MRHRYAGQQRANDLHAFLHARVTFVFMRPIQADAALVDRYPAAERYLRNTAREQQPQRGNRLREHSRLLTPTARNRDHAEPAVLRSLHGRAEPRPREPGLTLSRRPGLQMVGRENGVESGSFRLHGERYEL